MFVTKQKKLKAVIFLAIFSLAIIGPGISLASLKLQQTYPAISGITGGSQSLNVVVNQEAKNTAVNVASMVKYFTDLAAVFAIGLAVLSLIIAGVQYLSSSGKPAALKSARTRAIKSFLGLGILVGAYLILQLVIPTVHIPTLLPPGNYLVSNVVLLNEDGFNQLWTNEVNADKAGIDVLVQKGLARYFGSQSPDLTFDFGQLQFSGKFERFTPIYIGFFGNGKQNIEVKSFDKKNFLGSSVTYKYDGVYNTNGTKDVSKVLYLGTGPEMPVIAIKSFTSVVEYLDKNEQLIDNLTIMHPPLSMAVSGIGSGVYLLGSDTPIIIADTSEGPNVIGDVDTSDYVKSVGGKGGQRFLQFELANFAETGFDFDDQAIDIQINNNNQAEKAFQDDLLVILFNQQYFQGSFRSFFQKKTETGVPVATVYSSGESNLGKNGKTTDIDKIKKDGTYYTGSEFASDPSLLIGNVVYNSVTKKNETIKINTVDQQGRVFGASSAKVFHLDDVNKNKCLEVKICNAPDLTGYCLAFTPFGKEANDIDTIFLPMPWLMPVPLPDKINGTPTGDQTEKRPGSRFTDHNNDKFNDNIDSIGIKGNCVVALYENAVKNVSKCIKDSKDCWDKNNPGQNSQVFSFVDMTDGMNNNMRYKNLANEQLNSCVFRIGKLKLGKESSCASAIEVFPVR